MGRWRDSQPEEVRAEIKVVALRQITDGGPEALSINAIGRELGVTGPALYRYFPSRSALLTDLVIDAYDDFAEHLRAAVSDPDGTGVDATLVAFGEAYLAWARAQPHRYRLMYRPPLPDYDAHDDQLVEAAHAAMGTLLEVLAHDPGASTSTGRRSAAFATWMRRHKVPPRLAARAPEAVSYWARLHGLTTLDIDGNFASMGLDTRALVRAESLAVLSERSGVGAPTR